MDQILVIQNQQGYGGTNVLVMSGLRGFNDECVFGAERDKAEGRERNGFNFICSGQHNGFLSIETGEADVLLKGDCIRLFCLQQLKDFVCL
jgi:hypothetical protein